MELGQRIAELRKGKKWSQADIATKAGVSKEAIGKYERSEAIPSVEIAKKIADAFDVTIDYLVGEGQNANLDKVTLKRLEAIEQLDQEEKKTVLTVIDALIRDFRTKKAYA